MPETRKADTHPLPSWCPPDSFPLTPPPTPPRPTASPATQFPAADPFQTARDSTLLSPVPNTCELFAHRRLTQLLQPLEFLHSWAAKTCLGFLIRHSRFKSQPSSTKDCRVRVGVSECAFRRRRCVEAKSITVVGLCSQLPRSAKTSISVSAACNCSGRLNKQLLCWPWVCAVVWVPQRQTELPSFDSASGYALACCWSGVVAVCLRSRRRNSLGEWGFSNEGTVIKVVRTTSPLCVACVTAGCDVCLNVTAYLRRPRDAVVRRTRDKPLKSLWVLLSLFHSERRFRN